MLATWSLRRTDTHPTTPTLGPGSPGRTSLCLCTRPPVYRDTLTVTPTTITGTTSTTSLSSAPTSRSTPSGV